MAKRGRRGRNRGASNPLTQYGYPTNKQLRREAGQIANASVPTVRATTRPYKRQQQQVSGWLQAVLGALQDSSGQVSSAYNAAEAAQNQIDAAAQARLSNLGLGDYAAGVQAAQGARSDSAAANLLSRGASAEAYAAAQPGVATGYSDTAHATVQKALRDALAQRRDLRAQAFQQGLQQAQNNAMQRVSFLAGRTDAANQLAMQRAQLQQSAQQFQLSYGLQQQQAAEQVREFNLSRQDSNRQNRAQIIAQYGYDPVTGKWVKGGGHGSGDAATAAALGLTPNEYLHYRQGAVNDARDMFQNDWSSAMPSYADMRRTLAQKYDPRTADRVATALYLNPPKPPPAPPKPGKAPKQEKYDSSSAFNTARAAYQKRWDTYHAWLMGFQRYKTVIDAATQTIYNRQVYTGLARSNPSLLTRPVG